MAKTQTQSPMTPQTRDPFASLFGRLFADALPEFYGAQEASPAPRINISETEAGYELAFELPGFDEKDIQVHMQDHVLTVSGERKEDREKQGRRWHRVEHRYGQFSRTIPAMSSARRMRPCRSPP